jgi:predicted phosphodiesterase
MRRWLNRHDRWLRPLAVVLASAVVAVLAVRYISSTGDVGPGRVSLHGQWHGGGDTTIQVPPLGSVRFDTHDIPIGVVARVEEVDPAAAQRYADHPRALQQVREDASRDLRVLVVSLAWRILLVAALLGGVVGLLLSRRSWRDALLGAFSAGVVVVLLLGATWFSYSTEAFASPRFEGTLQDAPRVLEAVRQQWGSVEDIRGRIDVLAGQVTQLVELSALPSTPGDDDEVLILHVSDIHSNPLGLEIVRDLATNFDVDAIVDTGDLTSFGFPLESRIGSLIDQIPVPYYLVPGNHDTIANRSALDSYANLTVVDGSVVDVGGVRILGVADPAVTADDGDSDEAANAKRDAQATRVAALTAAQRPDVLAVSTTRQAAKAIGNVPLIIAGNTHRRATDVAGSTRLLTVGSTGATGLGSFTVETSLPYEAELLHFRAGRLVVLDYMKLKGVTGDYTVSRSVIPRARASRQPSVPASSTTSISTATAST